MRYVLLMALVTLVAAVLVVAGLVGAGLAILWFSNSGTAGGP